MWFFFTRVAKARPVSIESASRSFDLLDPPAIHTQTALLRRTG
jgi:hypothetical protein